MIKFLVYNIKERHNVLRRTIGTRTEENESYEMALFLNKSLTPCLLLFLFMEMVCYFIYSNKVNCTVL